MIDPTLIPAAEQRAWAPAAKTLTRQAMLDLFENRIPYIRLAGAVTSEHCERLA